MVNPHTSFRKQQLATQDWRDMFMQLSLEELAEQGDFIVFPNKDRTNWYIGYSIGSQGQNYIFFDHTGKLFSIPFENCNVLSFSGSSEGKLQAMEFYHAVRASWCKDVCGP